MKSFKKMLLVVVAAMMMISSLALSASAAGSVKLTSISGAQAVTATYNGKSQSPVVTLDGKTLVEGTDYTVSTTKKNAGTYTVTITGIGHYEGTATVDWTIEKATRQKTVKVTQKAKKSSTQLTAKTTGKVTYKAVGSKIKVSKTGKVTLKKGAKAGTYKVKVTISGKNYKTVTRTIKVKVK